MPHQFEMVRDAIVKVIMAELVLGHVPEVLASGILIPGGLAAPAMTVSPAVVAGESIMTAAATWIAGRGSLPVLAA